MRYMAAFGLVAQGLYLLVWSRGARRLRALSALATSVLAMTPWLLTVGPRQLGNRDAYDVWSNEFTRELLREIAVN